MSSATAYYLRDALRESNFKHLNVSITLYERNNRLCGRVGDFEYNGQRHELYATLGHSANLYIQEIMAKFGLKKRFMSEGDVGVWDGNSFVFKQQESKIMMYLRFLLRYGLNMFFFNRETNRIIEEHWMNHYRMSGTFRTIEELLYYRMGIQNLTNVDFYTHFTSLGYDSTFLKDLPGGSIRWNYNQEVHAIHALGGAVGCAGSSDSIFSIEGGVKQLCEHMIRDSGAKVLLSNPVKEILMKSALYDGSGSKPLLESKYDVVTDQGRDTYDIVVMAAPLSLSKIQSNIPLPIEDITYREVHITMVNGTLSGDYFGGIPDEEVPEYIMTQSGSPTPFFSIGPMSKNVVQKDGHQLRFVKIFSAQRLDEDLIQKMFRHVEYIKRENVFAYPNLKTVHSFTPIEVGPSFYYTSPIEAAVSVMETAIMSGRNIALLITDRLRSQ